MACLTQERGHPCEMGGERFLRMFDYESGESLKNDALCPGSALVQADSNINSPPIEPTRRGLQAEGNSLSELPRLHAAETFNFDNASFSFHEFMRCDAYSCNAHSYYRLIHQATVRSGEV